MLMCYIVLFLWFSGFLDCACSNITTQNVFFRWKKYKQSTTFSWKNTNYWRWWEQSVFTLFLYLIIIWIFSFSFFWTQMDISTRWHITIWIHTAPNTTDMHTNMFTFYLICWHSSLVLGRNTRLYARSAHVQCVHTFNTHIATGRRHCCLDLN